MASVEIDGNGLEVLDRDECCRLLGTMPVGRIAMTSGALPTILPVNFLLDGDRVLIRTGTGSKLTAALDGQVVAFEVDDFDAMSHAGWSVVVTGRAEVVQDLDSTPGVRARQIPRWVSSDESAIMSIATDMISGRRIRRAGNPETSWRSA